MARLTDEGLLLRPSECAALAPMLTAGARDLRLSGRLDPGGLAVAREVIAGATSESFGAVSEVAGPLTCNQLGDRLGVSGRWVRQLLHETGTVPIAAGPRGQLLVSAADVARLEEIRELRGR